MEKQNEPVVETEQKKSGGKKAWLTIGIIISALAIIYLGLCTIAFAGSKTTPNVSVLGVEMGSMTRKQAQTAWENAQTATLKENSIDILLDGKKATDISLKALGATVPADVVVDAAWKAGHDNFITAGAALVKGWLGAENIIPAMDVNDKTFDKAVKGLAKDLDIKEIDSTYRIDEDAKDCFYITKSADGRAIDQSGLADNLRTALKNGDISSVVCDYTVVEGKAANIAEINKKIRHKPISAKYNKETGGLTKEKIGVVFDTDQAEQLLDKAKPGEEFAVPATIKQAKITMAELQKVLFRDVLGTYTTYASGSAARLNNVARATQSINGQVLNSGEEFWYNATLGERTIAAGYQAAPAYVGGKTVDQVGGGICQVSSTLYYATLLSNLEIVQRYAHQFAPAYITFGCDATVSWGGPDYAFKNNTDYPIKIVATYSNNNVTVTIYGTKTDDSYVRMVSQTLSSTPFKTVTKKTAALPAGTTQWEQNGYTGYTVKTYRNVYSGDGTLISSSFEANSNYEKRDAILLQGTKVKKDDKAKEEKKDSVEKKGSEEKKTGNESKTEKPDTQKTTNQD